MFFLMHSENFEGRIKPNSMYFFLHVSQLKVEKELKSVLGKC